MWMKHCDWLNAEMQWASLIGMSSGLLPWTGGEEAVWQGDRAVLLCAGETSQPVVKEEGILLAWGTGRSRLEILGGKKSRNIVLCWIINVLAGWDAGWFTDEQRPAGFLWRLSAVRLQDPGGPGEEEVWVCGAGEFDNGFNNWMLDCLVEFIKSFQSTAI